MSENKYWLSLEQWKNEKSFKDLAEKEFMTPPFPPSDNSLDRREFLKLMGASLALTSMGCIRRPTEKIIPYVNRPEDITPGETNFYASSYFDKGEGFGLIVKTREGRPIKVEGNPNHPMNQGGMSVRAHAHLLSLYDPDRIKTPKKNLFNKEKTNKETVQGYFDEMDVDILSKLKEGRTALVTDTQASPFSNEVIQKFLKKYKGEKFIWDTTGLSSLAESYQEAFGRKEIPRYQINKARVMVSINCDFLGTFLSPVEHSKKFSSTRQPTKNMSQLTVFESLLSLTGTNADERYRIQPRENLPVLLTLIDEVLKIKRAYPSLQKKLSRLRSSYPTLEHEKVIRKVAQKLVQNQGQSIVWVGGIHSKTEDEKSLLVLSHFLNNVLGNIGKTIDFTHSYTSWSGDRSEKTSSLKNLIYKIHQGQIQNVIIHQTNPLYSYPEKEELKKALKKTQLVIYTGDRMDETAQLSDYVIPDFHDLEKWNVWEFQKGIFSMGQPTIRPLIESRGFEENLMMWTKGEDYLNETPSWYDYLRTATSRKNISWDTLLKKGFVIQAQSSSPPRFKLNSLSNISGKVNFHPLNLVLYTTQGIKDGSLSNVSWLQEFPDPVTKICWDNYLCISSKEAQEKGLKEGQVALLTVQNQTLKVPVHIQPGQSDGVIALALGYGRTHGGKISRNVGVNAFPLAQESHNEFIYSNLKADLKPTKKFMDLAVVQGHHSMEGRQIVVETTLNQYLKNKKSGIHKHKVFSLWSEHKYPREKWAMVIDLNSCTGCGTCIIACQSENNIPVVGKKYVLEGREMHWIRVDRYYQGDPQKLESVVHQPIVCMHCDNAPCETVCPVVATVHSDEGTNDMIYNRCVGTRYCSHNCPYKVRRFNWFNYAKKIENPMKAALNPSVTVRSRGVMEKCTFCIHRIKEKGAEARLKNKPIKDGELQTACQQSCPANAIVFGNYNDKNSKVRKAFHQENAYALLEETNTQPSVRYRTKVRNTEKNNSKKSH